MDVREPERLLPLILDSAIELSGAERGFLIRLVGDTIRVDVARGFDGESLQANSAAVSRRVVQQVITNGEGLVTLEEDRAILDGTTLRGKRILAILCAPMRLRGKVVGVIYLDHRFLRDPFQRGDLDPLRLFADQAALTIEVVELEAKREQAQEQLEQVQGELRERETVDRRRQRSLSDHRFLNSLGAAERFGALLGRSAAARRLFAELERGSRSSDPLLVSGETGSGKSAVVRELHRLTPGDGPLTVEHCASLNPEDLKARLRSNQGGVLVLEGVEDASPEVQAALVVELRKDCESAGTARLVTTGTVDLHSRIREDLFFRLDAFQIEVPPLRDRREDIPLLLVHASQAAGHPLEFTANALQLLIDYDWPGNVLELEGVARRLTELEKKITRRDLPKAILESNAAPLGQANTMADMERRMVNEALQACGGNKAQAARRLGIQRSTLYRILARNGNAPDRTS